MVFGIFFIGCQKEKDINNDIIVEITPDDDSPTDDPTDPMDDPSSETSGSTVDAPNVAYTQCAKNFVLINKMLKKLLIETYVQSALTDMPGFHSGEADTRDMCPDATLSDPTNYPTTLMLDYGAGGCSPATGLTVAGDLEVDFTDEVGAAGTVITIRPQDNFSVSGYDIDVSGPNALVLTADATDPELFSLAIGSGENITITDPSGATTQATSIGTNSLVYDDNGTNDDPTDILDDIFEFEFEDLEIACGDGTNLTMQSEEPLVYDLMCDCIEAGVVESFEGRDLIQTIDFGYPATGGEDPVCDDEIEVTNHATDRSRMDTETINCP